MPTQNHAKRARIKVTRNGPYLVHGAVPLLRQIIVSNADGESVTWRAGSAYPAQETYALCRCGQSQKWPFCDGTHTRVHFDGTEIASREPYLDRAEETEGPTLRLTDVRPLCVHAGFCDPSGGTWNLTERSADPEARQLAIEQAGNCPSGRLVAWEKEGPAIEPELEQSIGLIENPLRGVRGPLWVRGGIPIEAADGTLYEVRNRVTLCACGKSKNKPFCDGSHLEH